MGISDNAGGGGGGVGGWGWGYLAMDQQSIQRGVAIFLVASC